MIDTILFDFFGTLVRYSPSRTTQEYSRTHDFLVGNVSPLEYDQFIEIWDTAFSHLEQQSRDSQVEFSMHDVLSEFLNRIGENELSKDAGDEIIDLFMTEWSADIKPAPHLESMLQEISTDYRLGIVSNTHRSGFVPALLQRFGIAEYFSSVVASVDHGRPKPHKSIYTAALSALGSKAESTVFVGDSYEHDYRGPRQVGMRAILISEDPPKDVSDAHVVARVGEVRQAIPRA